MRNFFYFLVGLMVLVSCQKKLNNAKGANSRLDTLIFKAKDHNVNHDSLQNYLSESLEILSDFQNDSLKRYYLNQVSNQYFNKGFMQDYLKVCKLNLELANEVQDSTLMPLIHYDLTDYYIYYDQYDKAYFHINEAIKILKNNENTWLLGRSYLNKAYISIAQNASIEAEIDAVKALKIAEAINDNRLIYDANKLLGGIFSNLKDYSKSEEYYIKALHNLNNLKEDLQYSVLKSLTYNTLGLLFKKQEKYKEALAYFQQGLAIDSLKSKNLLQYAIVVDNINHTKLNLGQPVSLSDFEYALKIRDSLNLKEGVSHSKIYIGDFYLAKQDTANAIINYKEALALSNEIQKHEDVLRVLKILATIEPAKSESYLKRQIFLTDSLNTAERNIRNKFTRIEYETELIEEEKKVLEKQNKLILIISIILFAFGILFYVIYRQKAKQKELVLIQKQQEANQKVINLMIDQQNKIEEGRTIEKGRISRELHDGVLSELNGIRLNLNVLYGKRDDEAINHCINQIENLKNIEKSIRVISHDLNQDIFFHHETFTVLLQNLAKDVQQTHHLDIKIFNESKVRWELYNNEYKINVYRTIQEAIHNCVKYAEASLVTLNFEDNGNNLTWSITDDGKGFEVQKKKKGIGLKNMQSRVELMKGSLAITSNKNEGTKISFSIPSNLKNNERSTYFNG